MIFRTLVSGAALAVLTATLPALAAPVDAASCVTERAVYELPSEDGVFRAQFITARSAAFGASNLYFRMVSPQRTYWFTMNSSNGYGGYSLDPISDPYLPEAQEDGPRQMIDYITDWDDPNIVVQAERDARLAFYTLDADLNFIGLPQKGEPAIPYLMAPELGLELWYAPSELSEDDGPERDPMPRGLFRFTECLTETPEPAFP